MGIEFFNDYISTVKFWTPVHIKYFCKMELYVLIENIFAAYQSEDVRKNTLMGKTPPLWTIDCALKSYSKIYNRAKKLNMETFCVQQMSSAYPSTHANWHMLAIKKEQPKSIYPEKIIYCGHPRCNKQENDFAEKCLCEGCKLIKYCCRKHQKNHWKLIHSQQCRE